MYFCRMPHMILEYFQKHEALIKENLNLCNDPRNVDAIHNLRLSVKRLRVVHRLTMMVTGDRFDGGAEMQEINALFKRAGSLRDVQVLIALCDNMPDVPETMLSGFRDILERRESKRRKKFEDRLRIFDQAVLDSYGAGLEKALADVAEGKATVMAETLIAIFLGDIRSIYHGSEDEERLHKIRTRLKEINYLNNIFNESLPVEDHLHITADRLRETGELAGTWHDHLVFEQQLDKYLRDFPAPVRNDEMPELIARLEEKKVDLLQEYSCILLNEIRI